MTGSSLILPEKSISVLLLDCDKPPNPADGLLREVSALLSFLSKKIFILFSIRHGRPTQESQRSGHLPHSTKEATNHYILFTEEEFERNGKRLLALQFQKLCINFICHRFT